MTDQRFFYGLTWIRKTVNWLGAINGISSFVHLRNLQKCKKHPLWLRSCFAKCLSLNGDVKTSYNTKHSVASFHIKKSNYSNQEFGITEVWRNSGNIMAVASPSRPQGQASNFHPNFPFVFPFFPDFPWFCGWCFTPCRPAPLWLRPWVTFRWSNSIIYTAQYIV